MIEAFSLRKCAEQLNGEVTHVTLFYWRHKILAALKQIPTEAFQDIVEMDETYFLYSEKGKRNIVVKSCLFTVTDTNTKLRLSAYSC
jgi:hypothetical protein